MIEASQPLQSLPPEGPKGSRDLKQNSKMCEAVTPEQIPDIFQKLPAREPGGSVVADKDPASDSLNLGLTECLDQPGYRKWLQTRIGIQRDDDLMAGDFHSGIQRSGLSDLREFQEREIPFQCSSSSFMPSVDPSLATITSHSTPSRFLILSKVFRMQEASLCAAIRMLTPGRAVSS